MSLCHYVMSANVSELHGHIPINSNEKVAL